MTIKQKLYKEYIEIHNKVCGLFGYEPLECSEEFFNSTRFQHEARAKSKNDWQEAISHQTYIYEREVERLRRENYFNTKEGKSLKENIEKKLESICEIRETYIKKTENDIEQTIKSWLGEQWGIHLGNRCMEVGIVKETHYDENKNKRNNFHFGLTFEVFFGGYFIGAEVGDKNTRFEMNYGCMSSFKLSESNNLRSQYLLGMGVFSTDTERLEHLRNRLTEYLNMLNKWDIEVAMLNDKLSNPFRVEAKTA